MNRVDVTLLKVSVCRSFASRSIARAVLDVTRLCGSYWQDGGHFPEDTTGNRLRKRRAVYRCGGTREKEPILSDSSKRGKGGRGMVSRDVSDTWPVIYLGS